MRRKESSRAWTGSIPMFASPPCIVLLLFTISCLRNYAASVSGAGAGAEMNPYVYVQANAVGQKGRCRGGLCEENHDEQWSPPGTAGLGSSASCGEEDNPCADIRSGLLAIPDELPEGTRPELRLMAGTYTGDGNVFLGDPSNTRFPASARDVRIVGWETDAGEAQRAVISCEGRLSPSDASSSEPWRGIWLSQGYITELANLTVTDCPGGGVGVDMSQGDEGTLSPATLSSVELHGNGGGKCPIGGGLYVTATTSHGTSGVGPMVLERPRMESDGEAVVTLEGCKIANNTAKLGGGIAVDPTGKPVSLSTEVGRARVAGVTDAAESGSEVNMADPEVEEAEIEAAGELLQGKRGGQRGDSSGSGVTVNLDAAVVLENVAAFGGGIWASAANVSLGASTVIQGNVAHGLVGECGNEGRCGGEGGGMMSNDGVLSMQGVSFLANRAETYQARDEYARGGGLSVRGSMVNMIGCSFVENTAAAVVRSAAGIGGGAHLDGAKVTVDECTFQDNSARGEDLFGRLASFGGGMAARGPSCSATISNSKFESNGVRRGGSGGAMWVENRATATLVHTSFVNNTAASSYTHKAIGGAISISGSARLELAEGCSLENNVARPEDHGGSNPQYLSGEGGGIHASGAGLSMTGVSLKRNRCETGALDTGCMGGAVSIIGWGAASSPAGDKEPLAQTGYRGAVLHGCSFESNEAKGAAAYSVYGSAGQGGAVAIRCAFPQISYSNFTRNSADGGSGAMPAAGGAVLLFLSGEGCLEAAHGGNKAAPEDTVTKFVNCTFEHNWAGPAFSSVRSSGELLDGGDAGHGAERDARRRGRGIGGALAAVASSPLLDRCLFRNNSAVAASPSSPTRDKAGGSAPVTGAPPSFGGGIVLACNCSGTWVKSCTLDENIAVGGVGGDLAVLTAASVGGSASPEACAIPLGMITTDFDDGGGAPGRTAERGDAVPSLDPRAGGSEIKAVMSDCTFRPAPSRTDPAIIPWSDGQSETTESPFVFILNGGMVDLVSPTFSASGQVFVAEVDRPLVSKKVETGDAHLRIFDSDVSVRRPPGSRSSASSRGGTRSGEDPEERGMSEREISVVSVGGTVSLMGTSAEATTPAANRATLAPFPLQDLLVLGGELVFNNRGVAVSRSARIRMASVSETGSFFRQAGEVGETGGDDDRHDGAVGSGGGSDSGKDWTSRPVAADGMDGAPTVLLAMEVTGSASLGEAWEPKPFFLGTWLSQLFPTPLPASSAELSGAFSSFAPPKVLFEAGEVSSVGGPRDGGGIRDGDDDRVTFTGVDLRLGGDSLVSGKIVLNATSAIKVDPTGRLTLAGNATFKRKEVELRGSIDSAKLESNGASATTAKGDGALGLKSRGRSLPAPPVVSNAGLISIPRGFSLTVDGGIRQEGNGACHLGLPAPLFTPPVEDVGIGEGDDGYLGVKRVYPLVVKSGEVNLAGTVNVSVTSEGGDAERVRIHRKWAIAKFASNESAAKADYGSVSVGAPPGVSMRFSMQQIPDDSDEIRHPVPSGDEAWEQEVESNTAEVPNLAWELQMEVASIECQHVISYANVSATGGPCQACLLNRECAWCAKDGHGACESAAKGPVRGGYGGRKSSCQVGNCCPGGCNGVGQCDFFSATCSCPWLYAGTACGELSTRGAVALSLSLSALALIMLSLACGRSSRRKQMEAVMGTLQELRRGLLSDPDGSLQEDEDSVISGSRVAFPIGTKGSGTAVVTSGGRGMGVSGGAIGGSGYQHMWPKDYIQDLQQNLALRDVMVSFSELDISRKIGSGATGSVWRGSWRGAAVAVKMIRSTNRIDRYPKSNTVFGGPVLEGFNCYTRVIRRPFHQAVELMGRDLEVFKREAYLMTRLRHPNIVLIMGVAFAPPGHRITLEGQGGMSLQKRRELGFDDSGETQGSLCIVTELLSRGSLEDVIRAGGLRTASYALILNLALQAARGMLYLHTHSPPIIHRDLKSSNLVVDKHWHVKVTDFGMSRFVPKPVPAVRPSSSNATSAVSSSTASTASTTSAPVAPAPLSPSALAESPGRSAAAASSTPAHPLEILRATGDEGEEQEQGEEEENGEGDEPGHEEEKTSLRLGHPGRPGGMEGGADGGWNSSRRRVAAHGNKAAGRNAPAMGKETEGRGVQELGLTTNVGTVAWAAPEILMIGEGGRGEYTAKVDVYSFGVVLWELWERRRPFEDVRSRFDIADTVIAGGRPTIGRGCPPPYASLIRRCWHQDPSKRPSFQDVVENLERELESVQSFTEL